MTRAEKVALEAYPIKGKWIGNQYGEWDGDVNITLRAAYLQGYEQAEKDLAKALLAKYKEEADKCPDADYDHDYTVAETQQYGRFMMMEDIYEEFCEPVGVTLDDLEDEK